MLKPFNSAKKILFLLSLVFALLACAEDKLDPIDRNGNLTVNDYKKALIKNSDEERLRKIEKSQDEAPIPTMSKLIMTPPPPTIGGDKTISFSVTDQVPLKDVLIELGRIAKIDVDLDPGISGGIILNAKNRPLKEVIDRIANLGQLRYSYQNGVLHFERDTPYMKNYFVDYLTGSQLWTDVEANVTALLATSSGEASDSSTSSFSSNKSAGIISVFATDKGHGAIVKYLSDVQRSASAQVLIEARVIEVTLNDAFKTGINWDWINGKVATTIKGGYSAPSGTFSSDSDKSGNSIGIVINKLLGSNISASVSALEQFGTVKAIQSPRIHAINNQKALLDFSKKQVYFKVDATQAATPASGGASGSIVISSTLTSTKQEVDIGTQLEITPSINLSTNEIIMIIKPKLTTISNTVVDPASPRSASGNIITDLINKIPVVQNRSIETTAKIQSGNIIVIGGLIDNNSNNLDAGIPFLGRIPFIGWFFKSVSKVNSTVETVIFIKATIVNSGSMPEKQDREFNRKFDNTKRSYFN